MSQEIVPIDENTVAFARIDKFGLTVAADTAGGWGDAMKWRARQSAGIIVSGPRRRRDATPRLAVIEDPGHPLLIAFGPRQQPEVRCVGCCLVLSEVPPYKEYELVAR